MKKLVIVLFLLVLSLNVGSLNAFAESEEKVKVIYSSINVYADCNINADFNGDGENLDILLTAKYNDVFALKNADVVNGEDGLKYYLVSLENVQNTNQGYVLCSQVLSVLNSSPIKNLDVNAKTKNEAKTFNYVAGVYTQSEVFLQKGCGIKILDGYSKDKQYTLIQYKAENGEVVNAYILTQDIAVSGVSKTTVGAIVIIVTAVTLVLIIFGVKGKKKKLKK